MKTGSTDLSSLDKENIWHPFTPLVGAADPVMISAAHGVYLTTSDGREIIDAVSSWWVNIHGHSNPHIAEAIYHQAKNLEHVIFAGFTHEPAIRLSQNLKSILPSNQSRIFFSDNGSTAVEVALKMAMQYWTNKGIQRRKIIALDGAYHGDTFGAMAVGERGIFTAPFSSFLFDVEFLPFPTAENEDEVLTRFSQLVADNSVAAFIFEPLVQAAGGMRMYSPAILDKLIEVAKAARVITIADEVFTGFGRTGKLFASHYLKHQPEILCLSKGLTGGTLPLGVTSCSQEIVNAFTSDDFLKTFFHGHSYTANPIACAAANASFDLLMRDDCAANIHRISKAHERFMPELQGHEKLSNVRTLGTIVALELKTEEGTSYAHALRKKIYPFFMERNILLRPLGNVIYILPPYIITDSELQMVYNAIKEFLQTDWK